MTALVDRATKMLKLISWVIHDGQQYSGALNYAPLSPAAVNVGDAILKSATYDGKPILQQGTMTEQDRYTVENDIFSRAAIDRCG